MTDQVIRNLIADLLGLMVLLGMLTLYINPKSPIERHSLHNKVHFHNPFKKWLNVSLTERDMASFLILAHSPGG
jgi:hypothetical protein